MTDLRSTRRQILKRAGVLGATAALLSPTAALAKQHDAAQGPEGSWLITSIATAPGSVPLKALVTFDKGGGLVESNQGDEAPLSAALPILKSPAHGAWVSTGSNEIAINSIKLLYDTSGKFAGLAKTHVTAKLEGDTLTGSAMVVVTDPTGKVVTTGSATSTGTRIQAEGE